MPHFVVDCSQEILHHHGEKEVIARLHRVVNSTGLFEESDIKVRINPYSVYVVGGKREDFIHVFSWIMQGRSIEQRQALAKVVVGELVNLYPHVLRIAVNIAEFEHATYFNRAMMQG